MNLFDRLLSLNLTWRDAVDITIVAIIIYSILVLIRGTRAMQISIGLVILASTVFVARALDLPALEAISRADPVLSPVRHHRSVPAGDPEGAGADGGEPAGRSSPGRTAARSRSIRSFRPATCSPRSGSER